MVYCRDPRHADLLVFRIPLPFPGAIYTAPSSFSARELSTPRSKSAPSILSFDRQSARRILFARPGRHQHTRSSSLVIGLLFFWDLRAIKHHKNSSVPVPTSRSYFAEGAICGPPISAERKSKIPWLCRPSRPDSDRDYSRGRNTFPRNQAPPKTSSRRSPTAFAAVAKPFSVFCEELSLPTRSKRKQMMVPLPWSERPCLAAASYNGLCPTPN